MFKTLLVCLFAFAALCPVGEAGISQLMFGVNTRHHVRLGEVMVYRLGGPIRLKNYCPKSPLMGEWVVAGNGLYDRDPYIEGTARNLNISCEPVGPNANCDAPISVNITQFC